MGSEWLLLLPSLLLAALLAPVACRRLGWSAGYVFAAGALLVTGVVAAGWAAVIEHGPSVVGVPWMPALGLDYALRLDGLGLFFAFLIGGVGTAVFAYAAGYMRGAARCGRFYSSLGVFFAAMLGIALADNLLLLFVFWELTSFASFLLIGFDHEDESARAAATQALLITAAGGLALLAGVLLVAEAGGSYSLSALMRQGDAIRAHAYYPAATLLLLTGAFTKSAQFPFHFWLPNAMAAPTPVSAYLHSAAMVKAGIFLLLRLAPLLGGTALWQGVTGWAGLATAITGAVMALGQTDSKRMVAYATVSALGVLVMLAAQAHDARYAQAAALFLAAHALYKGALFMLAGSLAHVTGTRELTRWSGLRRTAPALAVAGAIVAASMAAVPPAFSFIAKEEMLAAYLSGPGQDAFVVAVLFASGCYVAVAAAVAVRPFAGPIAAAGEPGHRLPAALIAAPLTLAVAGVAPAFWAEALAPWFASTAVAAQGAAPPQLALWHGVNAELGLSALSVAFGALLFAMLPAMRRLGVKAGPLAAYGPAAAYRWGVGALLASARQLTQGLQNGRLTSYLYVFFVALLAACVIPVWNAIPLIGSGQESISPRFYEVLLALFIALAAFSVPAAASPFAAVAALGMVGYGVAIAFVLFGAPDLAMTQFLIETLMIVLFVLVFFRMKDARTPSRPGKVLGLLAGMGVGVLMAGLALLTQGHAHQRPVADYFTERSLSAAHGRNIVNVILVDFRAADTLGEITVLGLAAIGVRALLAFKAKPGDRA